MDFHFLEITIKSANTVVRATRKAINLDEH